MLLAKLALGVTGTLVLAGAYTFHDGVLIVNERNADGRHVYVWAPAAIVPMALHFVPNDKLSQATTQMGPWIPTLRALTKELEKYPEAVFVDVRDDRGATHVRVGTHEGKLTVDISAPDEQVHVVCPFAMMRDVADELEAKAPSL
jgi:hypothetical protein